MGQFANRTVPLLLTETVAWSAQKHGICAYGPLEPPRRVDFYHKRGAEYVIQKAY